MCKYISGLDRPHSRPIQNCHDKGNFCTIAQPDCKLAKTREQCAGYCKVCTAGIKLLDNKKSN